MTGSRRKASEVEGERFGRKKVWKVIRGMQHGRRGLLPCRTAVIDDEEGVLCSSKETQQRQWRRHFSKVLNLRSQFEEELTVGVSATKGSEESIAGKSTKRGVKRALGKLKNWKAVG